VHVSRHAHEQAACGHTPTLNIARHVLQSGGVQRTGQHIASCSTRRFAARKLIKKLAICDRNVAIGSDSNKSVSNVG
jgi:hypothetical protein